jgi:hypothetical protein
VADLGFDTDGRLVLPNQRRSLAQSSIVVVRRDQLEPMRIALTEARTAVDAARAERDRQKLMQFRALHGTALDTITSLVMAVPHEDWAEEDLLTTRISTGWKEMFGDEGELTITLRGKQIEDFAAIALGKLATTAEVDAG